MDYRERKCADTIAQCQSPGLAISNAKILIYLYFSNKIYRSNFIKQAETALRNCYGLKLLNCWLQLKKCFVICYNFWYTFLPCVSTDFGVDS